MGQQTSQMGQAALTQARLRNTDSNFHRASRSNSSSSENRPLLTSPSRSSRRQKSTVNFASAGRVPRGLNHQQGSAERDITDPELEILHDGCFPPHGLTEPCPANPCQDLPVYDTIHRIRRDVIAAIDDPYSIEQLRDPRMNISVVRPLVDRFYEDKDMSMVYCLLVNRSQFLRERVSHSQNVCTTRALLCEIVASRILRRFHEDNPGAQGLLLLAQILVGGFDTFQGAPEEVLQEQSHTTWTIQTRGGQKRKLPALEIAIISESKTFLSSNACQKVVNAIYEGRVVYTPSSFLDILPDHYKQKPIALYHPRKAPLLNQYRLIVPRTRNYLEVGQFIILLVLFLLVMAERDPAHFGIKETCFIIYSFGWILDQFACILEHGWHVYTQNLWSFLDVTFSFIFFIYFGLRVHGYRISSLELNQQALDVLAMGAPVLIPRLAFNLMSENMLFVSLRAMMRDFTVLTGLAVWCFAGFLLSMTWLSNGTHETITISKWMLWVWFGLDGTGIQRSVDFHWLLGPILMVAFAFLGNTLFLTILVSMLSTTFSTIVSNATAEIQFRRAVLTLEGVKSDAIFAYQPPFNIPALLILLPLKFVVTPRWFHKINVAAQRTLNGPLLLIIGFIERRSLWSGTRRQKEAEGLHRTQSRAGLWDLSRGWSVHGDISAVFESAPPEEDDDDEGITEDEEDGLEMGHEVIEGRAVGQGSDENQFETQFAQATRKGHGEDVEDVHSETGTKPKLKRSASTKCRRDSVAPWLVPGGLQKLLDGTEGDEEDADVNERLQKLEKGMLRIELMLERLCGELGTDGGSIPSPKIGETGTLKDLDRSGTSDIDD